jgi:methionyl-tRNA formyltransferase
MLNLSRAVKVFLFRAKKFSGLSCHLSKYNSTLNIINNNTQIDFNKKVIFFGSDAFSLIILKSLHNLREEKILKQLFVITSDPSATKGSNKWVLPTSNNDSIDLRSKSIIDYCIDKKIDYIVWSQYKLNQNSTHSQIKKFDVGVLASFGEMIPSKLIKEFKQ